MEEIKWLEEKLFLVSMCDAWNYVFSPQVAVQRGGYLVLPCVWVLLVATWVWGRLFPPFQLLQVPEFFFIFLRSIICWLHARLESLTGVCQNSCWDWANLEVHGLEMFCFFSRSDWLPNLGSGRHFPHSWLFVFFFPFSIMERSGQLP